MFTRRTFPRVPAVLLSAVLSAGGLAAFSVPVHAQSQTQTQAQERIYGSQLMTEQERNEYRNQMRNARTAQERETVREQHHQRMVERARERGVQLPDEPPQRGQRAAPGGGMGPGAGMGGGRGR